MNWKPELPGRHNAGREQNDGLVHAEFQGANKLAFKLAAGDRYQDDFPGVQDGLVALSKSIARASGRYVDNGARPHFALQPQTPYEQAEQAPAPAEHAPLEQAEATPESTMVDRAYQRVAAVAMNRGIDGNAITTPTPSETPVEPQPAKTLLDDGYGEELSPDAYLEEVFGHKAADTERAYDGILNGRVEQPQSTVIDHTMQYEELDSRQHHGLAG